MKIFKLSLLVLGLMFIVVGCKKTIDTSAKDIVWDRVPCERCAMKVGDMYHSGQVVNPEDGAHYYFDDLGCATLWLDETTPTWKDKAIIYFTDGATGKWVNKDNAIFADGFITPMAFGVAAFSDKAGVSEGKTIMTYDEVHKLFLDIKQEKIKRKSQYMDGNQ